MYESLDSLCKDFSFKVMETLVWTCPELKKLSDKELDKVIECLRNECKKALPEFMKQAKESPWMTDLLYKDAVLECAKNGKNFVKTLKEVA